MKKLLLTLGISILSIFLLSATTVTVKGSLVDTASNPLPFEYLIVLDSISGQTDTIMTDSSGTFCYTMTGVTGGEVFVWPNCQPSTGTNNRPYVCGDTVYYGFICGSNAIGGGGGPNFWAYVLDSLGFPVSGQYVYFIDSSGNFVSGGWTDSSGMICDTQPNIAGGWIVNCNGDTVTLFGGPAITFINCPSINNNCYAYLIVNGVSSPILLTITNYTTGATYTAWTDSTGYYTDTLIYSNYYGVSITNCLGGTSTTQWNCNSWPTAALNWCSPTFGYYCVYVEDSVGNPVIGDTVVVTDTIGNILGIGVTSSTGHYCDTFPIGILTATISACTSTGQVSGQMIMSNTITLNNGCTGSSGPSWCLGYVIVNGATGPVLLTITDLTTGTSYTAWTDSGGYYTDTLSGTTSYLVSATNCFGGVTSSQWNCNSWPTAPLYWCSSSYINYCVYVIDSSLNPVVGDTVIITDTSGMIVSIGVTWSGGVYCDSLPPGIYTATIWACTGSGQASAAFSGSTSVTINNGCSGTSSSNTLYCAYLNDTLGNPVVGDTIWFVDNLTGNSYYGITDINGAYCDTFPTATYVVSARSCNGGTVVGGVTALQTSVTLVNCTPLGGGWSNNICGVVYDDTLPITAMVYLIQWDTTGGGTLTSIDSTLALGGSYCFNSAPSGQYFLKAFLLSSHPSYSNFLPTYYGDVASWYLSNTVFSPNPSLAYDIHLIPGVNPGGPGFVGGLVVQGANKTSAPGDPLQNVQVNIRNTTTNVMTSFDISDASGAYEFPSLAYGTYEVCVDIIGHTSQCHNIVLSSSTSAMDYDFKVNSSSVEAVRNVSNIEEPVLSGYKLYPNPTINLLHVEFEELETSNIEMQIIGIDGKVVSSNSYEINNNRMIINTQTLVEGLYNLQLIVDGRNYNSRFIKN